jgi:hypothetical protein
MSDLAIFLNTCTVQWNEEMKKELPKYNMRFEDDKLYVKTSCGTYRSLHSIVIEGSTPLQQKILKYINAECPISIIEFIRDQIIRESSTH